MSPRPDCCMVAACSSHMAVPHALMRCPISRNANRVLRPSLRLYDVWTHKSFPETAEPGRSEPDQARAPVCIRWRVCFQSPDSFVSYISRKEAATLKGLELFFFLFQPLVIQLFISWQETLLLGNTGLDYILELYLMSYLNTRKCWELFKHLIIP